MWNKKAQASTYDVTYTAIDVPSGKRKKFRGTFSGLALATMLIEETAHEPEVESAELIKRKEIEGVVVRETTPAAV